VLCYCTSSAELGLLDRDAFRQVAGLSQEAICEAVTRLSMRFVETKTPEQQSCLMLHRTGISSSGNKPP